MAHTRLLFALALLLSAISCSGPASPQAGTSPTPAGGAPSPTPVTQTVRPAWPTQVDSLGTSPGTAAPYAVTQGAVYGLWDVSTATATPFAQPAGPTKSAPPTIGQPIAGAAGMAAAGGWVWVVTNPGASASAQLYQLNRNSLTVVSQRSLPVPVVVLPNSGGEQAEQDAALAAAPPWLWVAAGADLFRVDAATGSWTGPFPEGEELSSISTDPSGRVLYTSGETATGLATVREYSASTGSLLRQVTIPGAIVAPEVAAAAGGVWVGYTTGLRGGAELLSSQTLTRIEPLGTPGVPTPKVPSPEAPTPRLSLPGVSTPEVPSTEVPTPEQSSTEVPAPEVPTPKAPTPGVSTPGASTSDSFDQIGGVNVSVSDGALWLSGQSSLSCADPRTAAVGASETVISPPIVVAADGVLYASDAGALDVVSPPAICFG